jgi:uroporphyrin-III C-methyltransferase
MPHDGEIQLGKVWLVGAGPGAADLLTLRASRLIGEAQALLYDALVDEAVVALAPAACLKIRTGKRSGQASMSQAVINGLMLKLAQRGLTVVRLKGGDPSVFGRVGEEAGYLSRRGVAVEVVPGVTAASAAAAQFGFPLTHRGEARRILFATARIENGVLETEGWGGGADPQTTLVLYMGRDSAGAVAERLIALGRSPATPAIAVENAGRPHARAICASLAGLGEALSAVPLDGPVVVAIGEAVRAAVDRQSTNAALLADFGYHSAEFA